MSNNNNYNSTSTNSNNTNNNINTINNLSLKKISHLPKSYKTKEDLNSDLNYINSSILWSQIPYFSLKIF